MQVNFLLRILSAVAVCSLLTVLVVVNNNSRRPRVELQQQTLTDYLQSARAYGWSESVDGGVLDHRGGLLFQWVEDRIYSVAWWGAGTSAPAWPKVEGVGYASGNRVSIVYRNASGDPESDFYHALVTFDFAEDMQSFTCSFVQQESEAATQRSRGAAVGQGSTLLDLLTSAYEADTYEQSFTRWVKRITAAAHADKHCPVVPSQTGRTDLRIRHAGRDYYFCCPSCVDLFSTDPHKFTDQ